MGTMQRMDQVLIRPRKRRRYSNSEKLAYLNRLIKRANKAAGYDTDKKPNNWKWRLGESGGTVTAVTRSEARSKIKKELGLKSRLPVGIEIKKGETVE